MNPLEVLRYFQERETEMIRMIHEIVEIESPSCDVDASKLATLWIENEARKVNLELQIDRIPAENYGDHLLIRAFPGSGKGTMLLGHTDTVHPIGTKAQNPTRIEDGKFYGCGIFDMKSGIVLMLETLRYFGESGMRPASPINILLSCDEEVGSFTGRELVEREAKNSTSCLVFEPSASGRVKTGRKGTGMFTLRARGVPAHAGLEPEKGASAILELARQIEKIDALNNLQVGTTVNVCTIRGGTTTNVIPERAECTIDVRFSSIDEANRIETSIRELLPVDNRVSLDISGAVNRPPMERTDDVVRLFEGARSVAAGFGYEIGETQVGGGSDGNFVGALGVPVLDGLGIAGDGAHTLHEHILIDDIAKRATLVASLLMAA